MRLIAAQQWWPTRAGLERGRKVHSHWERGKEHFSALVCLHRWLTGLEVHFLAVSEMQDNYIWAVQLENEYDFD